MIKFSSLKKVPSFEKQVGDIQCESVYLSPDNRLLDSRTAFIAIVGERYNPLKHLEKVIAQNCPIVICESKVFKEDFVSKFPQLCFILVENIENYIQQIAVYVAEEFKEREGKIIAISGSNGKTTTKEMLFHLLCDQVRQNKVISTQKNNNNHLGVPFTLFQINENTKYAIVELGSNHPGEIEHLCKMIQPQFGVTTNIGDTHLEFFGNQENVFKEESILEKYASRLFLRNMDDKWLAKLNPKETFIDYGFKGAEYRFVEKDYKFYLNDVEIINKNITGKHNYINMMVAMVLCSKVLDLEITELTKSEKTFKPTQNRSQWLEKEGIKIYLDAYNANPTSMKAALQGFSDKIVSIGADMSKTSIIIGDMNELGDDAAMFHEELGDWLNRFSFGHCYFVGNFARDYALRYSGKYSIYKNIKELKLDEITQSNTSNYLMIKGSRSLQLESILDIK